MTEPPHRRGQDHDGLLHRPAITPALTAEEWRQVELPPLPRDPRDHALAALCLVDQPWGFTAEDVEACRALAQQERSDYAAFWRSLADRIEALLPPA